MKKALLVPLIILSLVGLILVGCAQQASPSTPAPTTASAPAPSPAPVTSLAASSTPKYGGTLKMVWPISPPGAIGWPPEYGTGSLNLAQLCVESLVHQDNKGNLHPWLAESYKVADDLKSITFNLRKGVKFHDGTDFNAQAAKWNSDKQIEAKKAPYWVSVDIIDDYTIRVNLTQWKNFMLAYFGDDAIGLGYMVSPTAFQKNGIDWMRNNPVGTGPFKFVSYQFNVAFKVVRNPDYWQKSKPYLDGMEVTFVPDPTTRKALMQSGEVDIIRAVVGKDTADYLAMGVSAAPIIDAVCCLIPDTVNADSPWANQKVREAVEHAIDREAIASGLGYGYLKAPYQIPARFSTVHDPNFTLGRKYDPDKAKQLLTEAGYPNGFKTSIICFAPGTNKDAVAAIQAYLLKVGIQVDLEIPDNPKYVNYSMNGWHNAALLYPIQTWGNINQEYDGYFSTEVPAYKSWLRTPEFIQAWNTNLSSPTLDVNLVRACTNIMTKDASLIPVYESGGGFAYQKYVMDAGWGTRTFIGFLDYEQIWLNK